MMSDTSTNVRPKSLGLTALRGGFRLLSGVAPGVAAKAAETLFCTPRKHRRPETERAVLERARPLAIRNGLQKLAGWQWGEGPAVLLAHGWEGRGAQLHAFVDPLVAAGYSVVTWDAPGHGESPGKQSSLVEFVDGVWAASRSVDELHGVVAHSMGCAALGLAVDEGLRLERAAFVAPPSNLVAYSRQFAELVGLSDAVWERMIRSMEKRFHVVMADLDFERMEAPENVPLLVVHDREDTDVPWEHGAKVAESWPGAELLLTDGHGHRRVLRDSDVVRRVVAHVAK